MRSSASAAVAAPSGEVRQSCLPGVPEGLPDAIRLGAQVERLLGEIPRPANDDPLVETRARQGGAAPEAVPSSIITLGERSDFSQEASEIILEPTRASDAASLLPSPPLPPAHPSACKKKRKPKPYLEASPSCRFRDLDQESKLKLYHRASLSLPNPPNFYIVSHVLDVDVEGKEKGGWMGLAGSYLRPVFKRVFGSYRDHQGRLVTPTYLYVWDIVRLDEAPPTLPSGGSVPLPAGHCRYGRGKMGVNMQYGLHVDLVLYVPPELEERLQEVLWDLARKRHLQAAKARGIPESTIRSCLHKSQLTRERSGLSIHLEPITKDKGGLDGLLGRYFPTHLRDVRRLAPVRHLMLPEGKRTQLVYASEDFRQIAQRP